MKSLDPWCFVAVEPSGDVTYPFPVYGHPFYREVPSWINYGDGNGTRRVLFDGAFVGADPSLDQEATSMRPYSYTGHAYYVGAEAPQRTGLTAEVAPVVAPATGGITVRKELDDKQVLRVEICVDGKCYRTSMDLAPAISLVMAKLARWHEDMHAQAASKVSPTVVVGAVDSAIGAAEDALIGQMLVRHIDTVCGSFLDDIGNAVKGVASGLAGGVASTFNALKGPIAAAAGIAAASGASLIPGVGTIAAPIAGKLANDLVQSASGDSGAKKRVVQANQQAKVDPIFALALDQAQKAVANATVAHHVQDTAKKAARGQPDAQQQIAQVASDAQGGDPAAQAVADLISNAMHSEWGAKLWEKITGRGPGVYSPIPPTSPPTTLPSTTSSGSYARRY